MTKHSFWAVARELVAAERASKIEPIAIVSVPMNDTTAAPAKKSKPAKTIEIRNIQGREYHADVMPKHSIRLFGFEHNSVKPHAYDITFKIGDVAVYGGYNLTYTGTIVSIGEKTVKIHHHDRSTVLKIDEFSSWNNNFDLAKIKKQNSEWMD